MAAQKRGKCLLLLLTGLLPVLSACQGETPAVGITTQQQDVPVVWSLPKPNQPVDLSGLTRLPVPETLRQRHTTSRPDPFAPLSTVVATEGTPPEEPLLCPLGLTGVALLNGQPHAFVEGERGAGSLQPGDVGGVSTDLLGAGLQVAAIDVPGRQLILRQSESQALVACRLHP